MGKAVNIGLGIVFHAALQPEHRQAGEGGGVEFREHPDVLLLHGQPLRLIPDIGRDGGKRDIVIVPAEGFPVAGIVEMVDGPLVPEGEGRGVPEGLRPAVVAAHGRLEVLNFQLENILHQRIDVRIVIVECVAVYRAFFRDVLDGDFIEGVLVQKL